LRGKESWTTIWYYPRIQLEGQRKITKTLLMVADLWAEKNNNSNLLFVWHICHYILLKLLLCIQHHSSKFWFMSGFHNFFKLLSAMDTNCFMDLPLTETMISYYCKYFPSRWEIRAEI